MITTNHNVQITLKTKYDGVQLSAQKLIIQLNWNEPSPILILIFQTKTQNSSGYKFLNELIYHWRRMTFFTIDILYHFMENNWHMNQYLH